MVGKRVHLRVGLGDGRLCPPRTGDAHAECEQAHDPPPPLVRISSPTPSAMPPLAHDPFQRSSAMVMQDAGSGHAAVVHLATTLPL
jgi:hypothetical protein